MSTYNFKHSNGTDLVRVLPLETNGKGNVSGQLVVVGFDRTKPDWDCFIINGDYAERFVEGFVFNVAGNTPQDGTYTVLRDSHTFNGQTFIPVDSIPNPTPAYAPTTAQIKGGAAERRPWITYTVPVAASPLMILGHGTSTFDGNITWGEAVQQNMLKVLENFASTEPPEHPLVGQFWYDVNSRALYVFHGGDTLWKPLLTDLAVLEAAFDQRYRQLDAPTIFDVLTLTKEPTQPNHVATKRYVDGYVNGVIWKTPIADPNAFDDSLTSPPDMSSETPYNKTFLVSSGEGEWAQFSGHAVQWSGSQWISVLGRPVAVGDRFGVFIEPEDRFLMEQPGGSFSTHAGKIATVTSVAPFAYTFEVPVEPDAVAVTKTRTGGSYFVGRGYTFRGMYGMGDHGEGYRWVEFVFSPEESRQVPQVPETSSSPGKLGDVIADDKYIYVYGAAGWRRISSEIF